jgi:hemerythrin superfamily protein
MKNPSKDTTASTTLDLLRDDHKKVKKLFEEFEEATKSAAKQDIVDTALEELEIHAQVEEDLVYPALRPKMGDEDLMDEALEEHHVAHVLIAELKQMKAGDERFDAKFTVLAENVKHHIKEEETEIFPKAQKLPIDWATLEVEVTELKDELMAQTGSPSKSSPNGAPKKKTH